jgi:hypothetical protein
VGAVRALDLDPIQSNRIEVWTFQLRIVFPKPVAALRGSCFGIMCWVLEEAQMPPVIVFALGIVGAAALVRWCSKEVQRVNAELDDVRARAAVEPIDRNALPKLKQDPKTGEYRPG